MARPLLAATGRPSQLSLKSCPACARTYARDTFLRFASAHALLPHPAYCCKGVHVLGFGMAKVLFLDIDGVVLSGEDLWRTGNNRYLPPEKIAMVQEVCDRTGAAIVVSSTWRISDETLNLLRYAGLTTFHPDWRTGKGKKVGNIWIGCIRGDEIADWLREHPEVSTYAIVDDDGDMLPEQLPRFVQTPFVTGLAREHVEALVDRLAA